MQRRTADVGWGRKAVERFAVDKKSQIEALRHIGIDVALYEELDRKAELEREIRKATIQQEQSAESKYFRYMKPGKQISPKEKELKVKIAKMMVAVQEERKLVSDISAKLEKCKSDLEQNWADVNKKVQNCFDDAERLERNAPRLANNCKKVTRDEMVNHEMLRLQIMNDIEVLKSECSSLDSKIGNQKTHVEYIRNYERLGLPRDLRKIDQLSEELRNLESKVFSGYTADNSPEVETLRKEMISHITDMGKYFMKKSLKNQVPDGLLKLVVTNNSLKMEKELLEYENRNLREEIGKLKSDIGSEPIRKDLIVYSQLHPAFSAEKIFPSRPTLTTQLPPIGSR